MFAACFDIEVIMRRGHRISATPQNYLWRDEHILSGIGSGMAPETTTGRAGAKKNSRAIPREERGAHFRPVVISQSTSGILHHRKLEGATVAG